MFFMGLFSEAFFASRDRCRVFINISGKQDQYIYTQRGTAACKQTLLNHLTCVNVRHILNYFATICYSGLIAAYTSLFETLFENHTAAG